MRIIFMTTRVPYTCQRANEYRNHQIIQALKEKHDVQVMVFEKQNIEEYQKEYDTKVTLIDSYIDKSSALRNAFLGTKSYTFDAYYKIKNKSVFDETINDLRPDIIIFSSTPMFDYIKNFENIKKINNVSKCLYMYYSRMADTYTFIKKFLLKRESVKLARKERESFVHSDSILFTNLNDMSNVNSQMQLITPGYYLPAYIDDFEFKPLCEKHHIMIAGNFQGRAGAIAYNNYLKTFHGAMKRAYKDYKLIVVGNKAKNMYKDNNIEFYDTLSEELLTDTRMFFMPYKFRAEMQYFLIKAMSYGVPVGGYTKSLDCFAVKNKGQYAITTRNNKELFNLVRKSFDSNSILEKIRKESFEYVKEHYNKEMFIKTLDSCIEKFEK